MPFPNSPTFADLDRTLEPGLTSVEFNGNGIGRGVPFNFVWWSASWYHLQLLLNNGNRTNGCGLNAAMPWDIPYSFASIKSVMSHSTNGIPLIGMEVLSIFEMCRAYNTGLSLSNNANLGAFSPDIIRIDAIADYDAEHTQEQSWVESLPARSAIMEAVFRVWMQQALFSFPAEHWKTPKLAGQPTSYLAYYPQDTIAEAVDGTEVYRQIRLITHMRNYGINTNFINSCIDMHESIWPTNNNGSSAIAFWESKRP
jgi:hypothetical protein